MTGKALRASIALMATTVGLAAALAGAGAAHAAPCETCPPGGGGGGTPTTYTLTVHVSGSGSVTAGANTCTSDCSWTYADGAAVSLTAAGTNGQSPVGWSGDCAGSGNPCSVSMTQNRSVTANFADITPPGAPAIVSPADQQVLESASGGGATVSFNNGGDSSAVAFLCAVDSSSYSGAVSCSSPWNSGALATGTHTAYVWAKDAANNISAAASRTFKVVHPASATVGGAPADGTLVNSRVTSFTYGGGDTRQCSLDAGAWGPCTPDWSASAGEGTHTLAVEAGVTLGATTYWGAATTRTWTVDSQAPDTSLTSGPAASTTDRGATFAFGGTDPAPGTALTYRCSLDGAAAAPCTSGIAYPSLGTGPHTFTVAAVDAAGNADATPATRTWTIATDTPSSSPVDASATAAPAAPVAAAAPGAPSSPTVAKVAANVSAGFAQAGRSTRVTKLRVTGVPAGGVVQVSCTGGGCPFATRRATAKSGVADLGRLLRKARLRAGAVLRVSVSAPGRATQVVRYTVQPPKTPRRTVG